MLWFAFCGLLVAVSGVLGSQNVEFLGDENVESLGDENVEFSAEAILEEDNQRKLSDPSKTKNSVYGGEAAAPLVTAKLEMDHCVDDECWARGSLVFRSDGTATIEDAPEFLEMLQSESLKEKLKDEDSEYYMTQLYLEPRNKILEASGGSIHW